MYTTDQIAQTPNALGSIAEAGPVPQSCPSEKIYGIAIRQVDHGYIIEVGCKTFVIESAERLAGLISMYLLKPVETFEKYCKGNLL